MKRQRLQGGVQVEKEKLSQDRSEKVDSNLFMSITSCDSEDCSTFKVPQDFSEAEVG